MNPEDYADQFVSSLQYADLTRDRTTQTHDHILGVSDVGNCREYARRIITGTPFTDSPTTGKARAGSYFHAGALGARAAVRPELLHEQEVTVALSNGLELLGHADEIDPDEPSVTDLKTVDTDDEVRAVKRHGADTQQRAQRHLYYLGAAQAGIVPVRGGVTRNVWMARAGSSVDMVHVEQEPYSRAVVDTAARWLDDALDAANRGTEAPKDKDYHWCERFCPFFTSCRGDIDPGPELTDPDMVTAARRYYEATEEGKTQAGIRRANRDLLEGANGIAGDLRVRTVYIDPSTDRAGYSRVEVKPYGNR